MTLYLKKILEIDEFLLELDEDVEGMQNTIYYLQQQLKEAKEKLAKLENNQQNDSVLQNINDNNQRKSSQLSSQLSSIDRTNERTFEMRAEVSDTHKEVAINGPNIDSDINNETLDSVESNEDFYVEKSSNNDLSTVSETEVNQNSIKNNNNNYLSIVNQSSNNFINECNNKRTSCFDEDIHIDDDYKEPIGKVAKLNEDISGNSSKQFIIDSNDNSQHSNDMTASELTSLQNNCIEINGQLNQ